MLQPTPARLYGAGVNDLGGEQVREKRVCVCGGGGGEAPPTSHDMRLVPGAER